LDHEKVGNHMTPEGKVKQQVKDFLQAREAYFFMPVQTGYGTPTLDFLGCYNGRFFAIETKAPGGKPTARQRFTIEEMKKSGAAVLVWDGVDGVNPHALINWWTLEVNPQ
jgi:hypothetical protein